MFQGSFKGVWKFQGCFMEVSRVFQESFKGFFQGISRMFQEIFKGISRVFQACFKDDLGVFPETVTLRDS